MTPPEPETGGAGQELERWRMEGIIVRYVMIAATRRRGGGGAGWQLMISVPSPAADAEALNGASFSARSGRPGNPSRQIYEKKFVCGGEAFYYERRDNNRSFARSLQQVKFRTGPTNGNATWLCIFESSLFLLVAVEFV